MYIGLLSQGFMTYRLFKASLLTGLLLTAQAASAASYGYTYSYSVVPSATYGNGFITRASFLQMVMQDKGVPLDGYNCFRDVGNQAFAPYVCGAKLRSIVTGYPNGTFLPNNTISFIEAAAIALRAEGEVFPQDFVWYRPYLERLGELNAIPTSVTNVYQTLTQSQAQELMSAINDGDYDYNDNDNDNDDDEDEDEGDDLTLKVRASDLSVEPGDSVTFTITIDNDDSDDITTDLSADLDSDLEIESVSDDGDEMGDDSVEWNDIDIDEDDSEEFKLKVQVDEDADDGDDLEVRFEADDAEVTMTIEVDDDDDNDNDDDDDDDNDDEVTVSITDSDDPVDTGDSVTYRIKLENHDEDDDATVDVTAMLDDDMIFETASHSGDEDDDEVQWDNIRVPEDDTVTLTLKVRISSNADDGDTVELTVETDDDEDTEETEIDEDGGSSNNGDDISVDIIDSPDPAERSELITYRITITNDDSDDRNVDVHATLDDRTTLISASTGGEFRGDDEVEWDNLLVEGDDDRVLLLTVRVKSTADDGDTLRLKVEVDDDEETETTKVQD